MTVAVRRLQKITAVTTDARIAADYLVTVFGAERLSAADGEATTVIIGMGDVVLELMAPGQDDDYWGRRLVAFGPGVVSLAYAVADVDGALEELRGAGLATVGGTGGRHVVDATALVGFDLELVEGDPASGPSAPRLWGTVSPLMQIEVTHHDIDAARTVLASLFGSGDVETVFSEHLMSVTGGRMVIRHVDLGDGMLQYIQPRDDAGPWWDQLQERGPSIHNLTWFVDDMATVERLAREQGTSDLRYFEFDYSGLFGRENDTKPVVIGRILNTRALLGFHIELSEPMSTDLNSYLFKQTPSPHFG
jgi:hypothetical protein